MPLTGHNITIDARAYATPVNDPEIVEVIDLASGEVQQTKTFIAGHRYGELVEARVVMCEALRNEQPRRMWTESDSCRCDHLRACRFVLFVRHATQRPYQRNRFLCYWRSLRFYCHRPMLVRTDGMPGNDEKTWIEAFASPGCSKVPHATRRGRKNRGVPPPATFDIDTLPGSSNLTVLEAAAIIRRTPGALEQWRRNPNHPLKWRCVDGRPLYRVDAVREYLAGSDKATKRPQPHSARGDGRAARP